MPVNAEIKGKSPPLLVLLLFLVNTIASGLLAYSPGRKSPGSRSSRTLDPPYVFFSPLGVFLTN